MQPILPMRQAIRVVLLSILVTTTLQLYAVFHTTNPYIQQLAFMVTWFPIVMILLFYGDQGANAGGVSTSNVQEEESVQQA
jgi:hypothetical protein